MVCNTLPPFDLSGAGEQVLQLARGLRRRGFDVEVIGRGPGGARGPKLLFPLAIVLPVLARLRRRHFAVLQVHESDGGILLLCLVVLRLLRLCRLFGVREPQQCVALQQVTYVREFRAVRPLRDLPSGRVLARPTWRELVFRWCRTPLQYLLGKISARLCDVVLAPSLVTADELRHDYGARQVEVVPNAVEARAVAAHLSDLEGSPVPGVRGPVAEPRAPVGGPLSASPATDARPFIFVGRLRIRKGVEVLLEAMALVPEARLEIIGNGERLEVLRRRCVSLGLADRVRLLGRQSAEQIDRLLENALALVVPSTYEGMPLVILEAMDHGLAVVASSVSGIPEVVVAGETGWLVEPESVDSLASSLRDVLAGPVEAQRRGQAGRARLDAHFRPAAAVESWLAATGLSRAPDGL